MLQPINDRVEQIWEALEAGNVEEAFELAGRLNPAPDEYEARLAVAVTLLEAGSAREAYSRLTELGTDPLDDDMEFARRVHLGEAAYALGEMEEAFGLFESLEPSDPSEQAQLSWWLGLCHDHQGDSEQADRCFRDARAADPESVPLLVSITPDEVRSVVERVAKTLPAPIAKSFEEVPVVIEDLPAREIIRSSDGEVHPDTLGLYVGTNLLERSHMAPDGLPPTIYIYRRNLERFVDDREELEQEIRTTLLHELGHHLGYEEEDLDRLGLA
ncbi:MAG: metallopeptidase family protein [Planctomycetota bacterium]